MARNFLLGLMMFASTALISGSALADEPSLHQIYQAAEAGKLTEAQTMMQEVLRAHPNSGKAHFVEAELLVKQGQLRKAEAELATAERLAWPAFRQAGGRTESEGATGFLAWRPAT